MKKKILITGGAGFIGSHLADELIKHHDVTVLDNLSVGEKENLDDFMKRGGKLVVGDVRDAKIAAKVTKEVDIIFHLAVQCVRLSFKDPELVHSVNTRGTLSILEAARNAKVKKFAYISSSEIYGVANHMPLSETESPQPTTIYGASKLAGEFYTLAYARSYQLPVVVVRPFNSYGPRSHFNGVYGEVIPKFFIRAINKKPPIIFGDGKQTRDLMYVADTVSGIVKAGFAKSVVGEIVNIGFGKETSINDLVTEVLGITHATVPLDYRPSRPGDLKRLYADTRKAKKLLHFSPKVDLHTGLMHYFKWLKKTHFDFASALKLDMEENWR